MAGIATPLASLVFVAPLLAIYEAGVLWRRVPPNGAHDLMQRFLDLFGFSPRVLCLLLPALVVAILLSQQHLTRRPWRISAGVVAAMAAESIALGLCLRAMNFAQNEFIAIARFRRGFGTP